MIFAVGQGRPRKKAEPNKVQVSDLPIGFCIAWVLVASSPTYYARLKPLEFWK